MTFQTSRIAPALSRIALGIGALALATTSATAQVVVNPVGNLSGEEELDKGIDTFNGYYGATVYAQGWAYVLDIQDEATRQAALDYLVTGAYYPTGSASDPSSLVPATVLDDPNLTAQDLKDMEDQLDGLIEIGDSVARIDFVSADIGAFTNFAVYDDKSVVFAPLLGNTRIPGLVPLTQGIDPEPVSTLYDSTSYLWGSTAESFTASVTALCEDGELVECQSACDADSGFLASAEISCEEVESNSPDCCKLKYEYAWATGFKSVEVTAGEFGVSVTGYIGQSGGGEGTLLDCCD